MAVTSVALHWNGTTGYRELLGKRQYTAVYKVVTDSPRDQTAVICNHFQYAGNLPYLGSPYSYGNDSDTNTVCTKIDPRRESKSAYQWEVTLTYSTLDGSKDDKDQNPDDNGNMTDDPAKWISSLDISFRSIMIPAEKVKYRGGFKGGAAALTPIGKEMMAVNSALLPFVPPPEKELYISVVRRQYWDLNFNQATADSFIGRVNSNPLVVNTLKYTANWAPFTVKVADFGGSKEYVNGQLWWHKRVELHINPLGWRKQICDRGLHARAMAGDPDGRGGTISASDLPTGAAPIRRIEDAQGNPVREPVLLDGDGQPLITDMNFPNPVYITYEVDEEIEFPDFLTGVL